MKSDKTIDMEGVDGGGHRSRFARKSQTKTVNNDETYFGQFKKIDWLIAMLVIGIAAGVCLVSFGLYRKFTSTYSGMTIRSEAQVQADVNAAYDKYEKLEQDREDEYQRSALSEHYYEIQREMDEVDESRADLEEELFKVKSGFYDKFRDEERRESLPYIISGIVLILVVSATYYAKRFRHGKARILTKVQEK